MQKDHYNTQLQRHLATITSYDRRVAIGNPTNTLYNLAVRLIYSICRHTQCMSLSPLLTWQPEFCFLPVFTAGPRLMVHFLRAEKAAVVVHSHPGDDWQALRPFSLLYNVRVVGHTLVVV
jgi:hypothetical protein